MPDYKHYPIPADGSDPPELPAPAAVPLQATSSAIAHNAMHALDTLPGSGHRVVFEAGLRGSTGFLVPDGAPPDAPPPRIYPDATTGRVLGRGEGLPLTPGHFLGLDVVALPSGPTQDLGVPPNYVNSGTEGRYELEATYTNGDLDTVDATATVIIPGSVELYGGEPSPAHAALFTASVVASPDVLEPDNAHMEKFTRGNDVQASWTLTAYGSPRGVDVAVVERGSGITVDQASSRWPSAMYVDAGAHDQLPGDFPVEQVATADPSGGTIAVRRALREHGLQLGPILAWFNSATESSHTLTDWVSYDGGTGDDEAPSFGWTGGGETQIPTGLAPMPDFPGFLLGHYARQVEHGDDFFDGRTGVLPVWFAAYIKSTDASVTFRTDAVGWSSVTASTTAGAWEWVIVPGFIEVGTGPEDAPTGQLIGHGDDDGEIRYACVCFRPSS
jgi:hypothetical protein